MQTVVLATDFHISEKTVQRDILDVINQVIDYCSDSKLPLFILGDVFTNRKSIPLHIIAAFDDLLEVANDKGVSITMIAGNHDKVDYESEDSYLDVLRFHPNVRLIRDYGYVDIEDTRFHFIPFFDEKTTYSRYLAKVEYSSDKENVLLTHIAIDGVRNNDGSVVEGSQAPIKFEKFDKVFVGHYHDKQSFDNIHYIGSVRQNNFGEDEDKGFIVYEKNGDWYQELTEFKRYETVKIDANEMSSSQIKEVVSSYDSEDYNIRFDIKGDTEIVASIDKSIFKEHKAKFTYNDIDIVVSDSSVVIDSSDIPELWQEFAKQNDFDNDRIDIGLEILNNN